jgi:hypothetical protein
LRRRNSPAVIFLTLVAGVFAALLAYPLAGASAHVDDFVFIALGRHVDNPLPLLLQDSVGTYFFRPLVMLVWWVSAKLFADHAATHYALNMAVHGINGLILFALARQLRVSRLPAALAALAFIAHPSTFSAAAWLSDRFDLFATAFGLLALIAVERFLEVPRPSRLALIAFAALASLFSKETGFALVGTAVVLVAWRDPSRHEAEARGRILALGVIAGSMLLAAAIRWLVLRDAAQSTLLQGGLVSTLASGSWKWLQELPRFIVVTKGNVVAIGAWCAILAVTLASILTPSARRTFFGEDPLRTAAVGIALMAAAAAAQSPVVNAIVVAPHSPDVFDFASLAASRFYYAPLAGLALVLAAAGEAIARSQLPSGWKQFTVAVALCSLAGLMASSRTIGREWSAFTQASTGGFTRASAAAIASARLAPGCKVYLLETPAAARHFRDVADTAVKSTLAPGHPAMSCFIQSESAPWYHLVARQRGSGDFADPSPMENILVNGKPYPPLPVGNLAYHYLRIPDRAEVIDDPRATFLAYQSGRFVDVTAQVRSRERVVRFLDTRPAI